MPILWAQVLEGTGTGSSEKPRGYPWYSLFVTGPDGGSLHIVFQWSIHLVNTVLRLSSGGVQFFFSGPAAKGGPEKKLRI